MNSRCEFELDTAVTELPGKCSAIHSESDTQPPPSSRIFCPSASPARSHVTASADASASASVFTPSGQWQQLYFRCGPSDCRKYSAGTS